MRTNAGYAITDSVRVGETEFVLGEHSPTQYVTWHCSNGDNYYWGHYFDNRMEAVKDLLQRARDHIPEINTAPPLKPHFFCMTVCALRTGIPIGRRCGVVLATDQESAEQTAWARFGDDNACKLWAQEVPENGYGYCGIYVSVRSGGKGGAVLPLNPNNCQADQFGTEHRPQGNT